MADLESQQRWQRRTEWPLAAAALVFLVAYAWPILEPGLQHPVKRSCEIVVYVAWLMFAVDYAVRLYLAERKWSFVGHNVIDLLSIALPVLRPLRLLRLVALVRILNRRATSSLQGRVAIYVGSSTVLVIFVAALAVVDAERGKPGSNINSVGDALWWSATTVTTVGYGDRYPVTVEGRFVAVGLMLGGITLIGVVTASIASWLIARVRQAESDTESALLHEIDALRDRLTRIESMLVTLTDQQPTAPRH